MPPELDIVILGATGFTGRRAVQELWRRAPGAIRWGVAGRSPEKIAAVAREFGDVPSFVVDVHDREALVAMVQSARVIVNTAGPFAVLGDPVVEACVAHGAHYCDLAGEVPWMRRIGDRFHATARRDGTLIVPACGFDSVPADLGFMELARAAAKVGERLQRVDAFYRVAGGLNGGTLATMLEMGKREDQSQLADPWVLTPDVDVSSAERERMADPTRPAWNPFGQRWGTPFFMHKINSRVVRRSMVLAEERGWPGAADVRPDPARVEYFEYQTVSKHGGRVRTEALAVAQRLGERALRFRPGRWVARRLGPAPGEGPSEEAIESGRADITMRGVAMESGREWLHEQHAVGDPGNAVTVRCLVQAALALAIDGDEIGAEAGRGGVLTPASAFGRVLVRRLEATGQHTFLTREREATERERSAIVG